MHQHFLTLRSLFLFFLLFIFYLWLWPVDYTVPTKWNPQYVVLSWCIYLSCFNYYYPTNLVCLIFALSYCLILWLSRLTLICSESAKLTATELIASSKAGAKSPKAEAIFCRYVLIFFYKYRRRWNAPLWVQSSTQYLNRQRSRPYVIRTKTRGSPTSMYKYSVQLLFERTKTCFHQWQVVGMIHLDGGLK